MKKGLWLKNIKNNGLYQIVFLDNSTVGFGSGEGIPYSNLPEQFTFEDGKKFYKE